MKALCLAVVLVTVGGLIGPSPDRRAWGAGEPTVQLAFLRGGDVYVLAGSRSQELRLTTDGSATAPWWAADGQTVFFHRSAPATPPGMWRWHAERGLAPAGGSDHRSGWSPLGAGAAVIEPRTSRWGPDPSWMETRVWVEQQGERWPVSPTEPGVRWEPLAWSPDGRRLALLRMTFGSEVVKGVPVPLANASLWVTDGDPGAALLHELRLPSTFQGAPGVPDVAHWSPDGRVLVVGMAPGGPCNSCRADGVMWQLVPVDGGAPVPLDTGLTRFGAVAWAPDGSFVVLSAPGGRETYRAKQLIRFDPATGDRRDLSRDPRWADVTPAVSPDGRWVAFVRGPSIDQAPSPGLLPPAAAIVSRRLWVMRADGSEARQVTAAPGWTDEAPMWSPDGQWLIFVRWRPSSGGQPIVAQLWAVRPDGSAARMLAPDLDPPTGLDSGFGYYGALNWRERFVMAPAFPAVALPHVPGALPVVGTGLIADARLGSRAYAGVGLLAVLTACGIWLTHRMRRHSS
jgi:dipeptidyl aminopeptidase/acylaminoacyl peptidase